MFTVVMDLQYKRIILFSVIGLSVGALLTGLVLFMGYRTCRASRETIAAVHQLIDENSGPGEKSAGRSAAAADIAARHTATHPTQYATAQVEETLDQLEDINAALLRDLDSLEAENFTLQELNDKLKVQIEDILNWVLVNYEGKHPLPMESVPALSFAPMDNELMLNPEVAEFLHITPAEEATINDAFAYARSVINQVEDELMTYTFPHPDKAILQIPPFYEDGELLRNDLYSSLEAAIGVHRFDMFLDITQDKLEESFGHFGEATHTIVFEVVYAPDTGEPRLKIKDGWVGYNEDNQKVIRATESTLDGLPLQYAHLRDYLPMDFPLVQDK